MKTAIVGGVLAGLALLQAGCGRIGPPDDRPTAPRTAIDTPQFATTVHVGDPKLAGQLISGFHAIESGAWRWTERQFTVALGTPSGAAQSGATLELRLTVPPP